MTMRETTAIMTALLSDRAGAPEGFLPPIAAEWGRESAKVKVLEESASRFSVALAFTGRASLA